MGIFDKEEKMSDVQEELMNVLEYLKFDSMAMFSMMIAINQDDEIALKVLNFIKGKKDITRNDVIDYLDNLIQK